MSFLRLDGVWVTEYVGLHGVGCSIPMPYTHIAKRTILLTVVLSIICSTSTRAGTEKEFFSRILDALPKASPGEFKTPDSVARFFVQGVIHNRIQDTFRCVPLARMFAVETFENRIRYVGNTYDASMGLPDDDYGRYLKLVSNFHYMPVQKCRVALLLADDQSKTNLVENLQRPSGEDPKVVNKWLETLSNDLSLSFPRQGGQGAEKLRKKSRHVHESETETNPPRSGV